MKNETNLIIGIVIALFVLLILGGSGMMGFRGYGMMSGFYGGSSFSWIFGMLIMILVIIALILFIFWLIKQVNLNSRGGKK